MKKQSPFIKKGNQLVHRSARGSRKRYQIDQLCRDLTISEMEYLLEQYKRKALYCNISKLRLEYRTICEIIRDHIAERPEEIDIVTPYWDTYGEIDMVREGEKMYFPEYDENYERINIRDSEGNIVDSYDGFERKKRKSKTI